MLVAGARAGQRRGYEQAQAEMAQQQQQQQLYEAQQQAAAAQQQLQQAQSQQVAQQASPAPAAPASSGTNVTAELQKLGELKQAGVLTDEEFAAAKKKLLGI